MKKLNLKSLLALVLTLCMLLGSVAALAEEEIVAQGTEVPATEVPQVQTSAAETPAAPAEPVAPAEATPTVTVAAGEAAGQVNVTITDDSVKKDVNTLVNVNAYANEEYNEETDKYEPVAGTNVIVNQGMVSITGEGEKLIDGSTDLNVTMGNLAINLDKTVEYPWAEDYNEDGVIGEGESGIDYENNASALTVYVDEDHAKENVTFTTGNVYAATSAKEGGDYSEATGVRVYNYQKESTVTGTVNGDIFAKSAAPAVEKNEYGKEASATALSVIASNGSTSEVTVTGTATATATSESGEAYATAESLWTDDKGGKVTVTSGDATANVVSSKDYTDATAVYAYASEAGEINGTFGNVTANATSGWEANAYGVYEGNANVKTGSITATATLTENKDLKPYQEQDAFAEGAYVRAKNDDTASLETVGNITAKSDKEATGLAVRAAGADKKEIWDEKTDEYKTVEATAGGKATAKVTGDISAVGTTTVNGINANASTDETYNKETKKYDADKIGGNVAVTVVGNVTATGSADAKSYELTSGVNASADANASAIVAITGDVTATGKNSAGIRAAVEKDGKAEVLVDGTVTGGEAAIEVVKSTQYNTVDKDGKLTEGTAEKDTRTEYDPSAVNVMVWKATPNADGRIATVYDQVTTSTYGEIKYTDDNGQESTETKYNSEAVRTVDAEASAKLEQAIWYIVRVADAWKDNIAAKGTNTYAVDGTSYELAHQYEDVTLTLTIPKKKKLSAIYYNDGVKADFVKNEDGTYTVKMLRGGAMELGLKLKNKYKKAAATTTTATEDKKEEKNWAYGIEIEGVGTVYYGRDYFKLPDIVNPLTSEPYTEEEIKAIVDGAKEGAEGYVFDIPEEAYLGMNDFWYDKDAATAITGHEDALTIDDNGVFTTADGEEVAKPIQK